MQVTRDRDAGGGLAVVLTRWGEAALEAWDLRVGAPGGLGGVGAVRLPATDRQARGRGGVCAIAAPKARAAPLVLQAHVGEVGARPDLRRTGRRHSAIATCPVPAEIVRRCRMRRASAPLTRQ